MSPAHPEVSVPQAGPAVFKHEGQMATQTRLFTLEERRDVICWLHVCNYDLSKGISDVGTRLIGSRGVAAGLREIRGRVEDSSGLDRTWQVEQLIGEVETAGLDIAATVQIRSPDTRYTFSALMKMLLNVGEGPLPGSWVEIGGETMEIGNERHGSSEWHAKVHRAEFFLTREHANRFWRQRAAIENAVVHGKLSLGRVFTRFLPQGTGERLTSEIPMFARELRTRKLRLGDAMLFLATRIRGERGIELANVGNGHGFVYQKLIKTFRQKQKGGAVTITGTDSTKEARGKEAREKEARRKAAQHVKYVMKNARRKERREKNGIKRIEQWRGVDEAIE